MAPSILSLLHLGADHKLFLSIRPSPVVPLGGRVTLSCHSQFPLGTFKLFKHNSSRDSEMQTGSFRHNLTLEPVSREHAGTCSCSGPGSRTAVSAQSDPRDIVVTGVATGPSLSAHPGPRVHKGGNVTLRCSSERAWDQFTLHKDGAMEYGRQPGQRLPAEQSQAHFPMGPVDSAHAGTYRCYGSLRRSPHEWSAPSDPLDLVVSGLYKKPSLSAHPGPVVTAGENVTLTCSSNHSFDKYHLSRDGDARAHQFPVVQRDRDVFRADFSLGPAPSGHSGTYRCYGSFRGSASQWSAPSDPVHLSVPGTAESTGLSPPNSSAEPGDKRGSQPEARLPPGSSSKKNLLRLSVALLCMVIVLGALTEHWCSIRNRTSGDGSTADAALVGTEPREDHVTDGEGPAAEEAQEVTYAQLKHPAALQTGPSPTAWHSKHLSAEPGTYTALAVHQTSARSRSGPDSEYAEPY
ncbi:putative killer cell immunoglobulin-like receptor like protein KIR3DP1 isoform X3 [Tupaia chinensis]|uniref:putative killer cell immunoglobulin-like receptor like protein KIR3DP1 isoform X3 n=1 Tax=Tupaia chinensis TaxID=246437 RepID=UPI000FFB989B|nr:putative killer cell immunoglobulin-like receptor like protein KIR3DP1 isoform X3 [Tupaia chinensis]